MFLVFLVHVIVKTRSVLKLLERVFRVFICCQRLASFFANDSFKSALIRFLVFDSARAFVLFTKFFEFNLALERTHGEALVPSTRVLILYIQKSFLIMFLLIYLLGRLLFLPCQLLHKTWLYCKRRIFLGVFQILGTTLASHARRHLGVQSSKDWILRKPIGKLWIPWSLLHVIYHYIINGWSLYPDDWFGWRCCAPSWRSPIGHVGVNLIGLAGHDRRWHQFVFGLRAKWLYSESFEVAEWL